MMCEHARPRAGELLWCATMPFVVGATLAVLTLSAVTPTLPPASLDENPSASLIAHAIDRLSVTGRVLYIAAHPDDENTRLLAWLVAARGLDAAYLSLTRGDGGQNLIGTEQDTLLGVVRTEELLAARAIDGAEQLFTRARDFGYSKSADETLAVWGKKEILNDVVRAIRRFRPDVVITRFSTLPPNHGHHTASALLAAEAFRLAGDPSYVTEGHAPHAPARLLHNVSTWSLPKDADLSAYLSLDVGSYVPLLGRSIGEIAARSRSQHKSQGFGAAIDRGPALEYFAHLDGTKPARDPLDGLDFTWRRAPGADKLAKEIVSLQRGFDVRAPVKSIPALARVHKELTALSTTHPGREGALRRVESLLVACAGLHVDARADRPVVARGATVPVVIGAQLRSHVPGPVSLEEVFFAEERTEIPRPSRLDTVLAVHAPVTRAVAHTMDGSVPFSTLEWLSVERTPGRFGTADPRFVNDPVGAAALSARITLTVAGARFSIRRPVVHVVTDPVDGERARPIELAPIVSVTPDRSVVVAPHKRSTTLRVVARAGAPSVKGHVRLALPEGWRATPERHAIALANTGDETALSFSITGPQTTTSDVGRVIAVVDGREHSVSETRVAHAHIRPHTVRAPSEIRLVPVALETGKKRVGYVMGAGDKVAESLAHVGYEVTLLDDEMLATADLSRFDVIVLGVRTLNTRPAIASARDRLLAYVERGGRLVVQYQTNSRVGPLSTDLFPAPLAIGRGRVTDEEAPMTRLAQGHAIFARPNALTDDDTHGWVQERGLYFASTWDARYTPLLSLRDAGEPDEEGALLVMTHGKGTFVYTGLSFFRQLPAGVPGAYRLMANVLAP